MIRQLLAASALLLTTGAAMAQPTRITDDLVTALDAEGRLHYIVTEYVDQVGDTAVTVNIMDQNANFTNQNYWVRCSNDTIADRYRDNSSSQWRRVDHRKMAGWYADAACNRI